VFTRNVTSNSLGSRYNILETGSNFLSIKNQKKSWQNAKTDQLINITEAEAV